MAPLRLHDDQCRPAGLWRGRRAGRPRTAGVDPSFPAGVRCGRPALRRHGDDLFRDCAAGGLQSAGDPVGAIAAAAPAAALPAAVRAVLLRGDQRLPGVFPLRHAGPSRLQLRHPGCRAGLPRDHRGAVRLEPGRSVAAGQRGRPGRGCAGERGMPLASPMVAGAPAGGGDGAGCRARSMDRAAAIRVQGAEPAVAHRRCTRGGAALQSARTGHGGGKPVDPAASRARAKPACQHRAAAATGRADGWRRAQRAQPL
ncbi:hypothetical protein D9M72_442530 [compost metagenome]